MSDAQQKDNSTIEQKVRIRQRVRQELEDPVVCEPYAGSGRIFEQVYDRHVERGVAMDKDPEKVNVLAAQRATWAVYECDSVYALREGVGSHLPCNLLDLDPYGGCWDAMAAFFESDRPFPPTLAVVVHDGMRQGLQMNRGWDIDALDPVRERYANTEFYEHYLDVCRDLTVHHAESAGYTVKSFGGFYGGENDNNTHFAAVAER